MKRVKKDIYINFFDTLLLGIIVLSAIGLMVAYNLPQKTNPNLKELLVTVSVTSDVNSIKQAANQQKQVYFDSSDIPVTVSTVDDSNGLKIVLSAPGIIENGTYIFNGQRVLVGQKAEIHSTYFAQGTITGVNYAN